METNRVSVSGYLILSVILFLPGILPAQEIKIDTSDYLPLLYEGALDYNLMVAAGKGYEKEVERLIFAGADIETESVEGATPLVYAVSANRLNAVKVLLKYNADPNKVTSHGQTPLLVAIMAQNSSILNKLNIAGTGINFQYLEIAEALIRAGADIDFQDDEGATALNYASIFGLFYFVDLLVYYGADVDKKANDGTSPLMSAVWSGYADIADLLITNGANIEARDNSGFTPFMIAAQNGDTIVLNLLVRNGANIYERNMYGWDALCLSIRSDHKEATEFLLKSGDKWSIRDSGATDPYDIAVKYGRKEIVELLEKNNFHNKYRFKIDQMAVSISSKFTIHDIYTGMALVFKEPFTNIGFSAGIDTKLWYTRVLIKESENLYYQYNDKSSTVYAGLFKEFPLTNNVLKSNKSFYTSLSFGYSFGNKFEGTNIVPESKFRIMPGLGIKWIWNKFILSGGFEFMKTEFTKIGPVWARIGCSYNFYFDTARAPGKTIKWF